jgi:2,4-dichlorophenol 6-monooxygenase
MPCDPRVFAQRLADPEARAKVNAAIDDQKDHFDSLRLQLGYAYGNGLAEDAMLPISQFIPKVALGARLPHVALRDGRSSLDLAGIDGFTLLCGPKADAWGPAKAAKAPIAIITQGKDFDAASGSWAERMEIADDGALLVRPDGHLLGIYKNAAVSEALQAIKDYTKPLSSTGKVA